MMHPLVSIIACNMHMDTAYVASAKQQGGHVCIVSPDVSDVQCMWTADGSHSILCALPDYLLLTRPVYV